MKRSDSLESTQSEREFRKKYQAITHRMVHRKSSAVMYSRILERTFGENNSDTRSILVLYYRDRREYRYRIETADTKPFGIGIGLDRGCFLVSVSVPVSIQRHVHFLNGFGRILIK